jgi:hypothetical protein
MNCPGSAVRVAPGAAGRSPPGRRPDSHVSPTAAITGQSRSCMTARWPATWTGVSSSDQNPDARSETSVHPVSQIGSRVTWAGDDADPAARHPGGRHEPADLPGAARYHHRHMRSLPRAAGTKRRAESGDCEITAGPGHDNPTRQAARSGGPVQARATHNGRQP